MNIHVSNNHIVTIVFITNLLLDVIKNLLDQNNRTRTPWKDIRYIQYNQMNLFVNKRS